MPQRRGSLRGIFTVELDAIADGGSTRVVRAALSRTAHKLMSGDAFVSQSIWTGD